MNKTMIFLLGSLISFSSALAIIENIEEQNAAIKKALENTRQEQIARQESLKKASLLQQQLKNAIYDAIIDDKHSYKISDLIRQGADINVQFEEGTTPLSIVLNSLTPNVKLAKLLLNPDTVNTKDKWGFSPLHHAASTSPEYVSHQKLELLPIMIDMGADLHAENKYREKPIDLAGHPEVKFLVFAAMRKEWEETTWKKNAELAELKEAIRNEDFNKISDLIRQGADINVQFEEGTTPLSIVLNKLIPNVELATLLLNPDTVNTKDQRGDTPLHYVATSPPDSPPEYDLFKNLKLLHMMIDMGADLNAVNKDGKKPIDLADHPEVKALLQKAMDKQEQSARN